MTEQRWAAVDAWFEGLLVPDDPVVDRDGLAPADVSALQGRLLELLVRAVGARRVLELGTLAGYSTVFLARGLAPGGEVVTLEADPEAARIARGNSPGCPCGWSRGRRWRRSRRSDSNPST
jgi:hypothetical protein